ncbi:CHAT domain-containing protein [Nostoc sp. JL33]|uniref:CHAT domain-containing protein n=1 Tax=Nostoc sp. JL33 TaxID=2815396 RepID=UPI0034418C62|nr:CHAT domain-containing protein [Nostoc sp. JL33]
MNSEISIKRILFLAANPKGTTQLRLGEESREIKEGLLRSKEGHKFKIETKWAVRPDDLRRAMLDFEPQIVHFSGHGTGEEGLALENNEGEAQLVTTNSLANLFKLFASRGVQCVVLNACYSEVQAEAIAQYINCVVGMKKEIGDKAAIKFTVGFYDGLGAGWSFEDSYHLGCNAIEMEGIPEHLTPILKNNSETIPKLLSNSPILNVEYITHDTEIFIKSDNFLSERKLLNFLEYLSATHCFRHSHLSNIIKLISFFEETSNQYIIEDLAQSSHNLVLALQALLNFTGANFYIFPDNIQNLREDTQSCLQPGMNTDRTVHAVSQEKILLYDEFKNEMYSYIDKIRELYEAYRHLVKKILIV